METPYGSAGSTSTEKCSSVLQCSNYSNEHMLRQPLISGNYGVMQLYFPEENKRPAKGAQGASAQRSLALQPAGRPLTSFKMLSSVGGVST